MIKVEGLIKKVCFKDEAAWLSKSVELSLGGRVSPSAVRTVYYSTKERITHEELLFISNKLV